MLFFDIMDVWKKAVQTRCEDLLLGRFEKGQKASRVLFPEKGAFRDMKHYEIYGPTIIVSNEQLHKILDTRCLPISMPNLPGSYENPHPDTAEYGLERFTDINIKTNSILKKLNEERPADKQITPQWIGRKLKSMSIRHRTINGRSEIVLTTQKYKTLLDQYGFGSRDTTDPTETLPDKTEQNKHDTHVVGNSGFSEQTPAKKSTFNSPEEKEI